MNASLGGVPPQRISGKPSKTRPAGRVRRGREGAGGSPGALTPTPAPARAAQPRLTPSLAPSAPPTGTFAGPIPRHPQPRAATSLCYGPTIPSGPHNPAEAGGRVARAGGHLAVTQLSRPRREGVGGPPPGAPFAHHKAKTPPPHRQALVAAGFYPVQENLPRAGTEAGVCVSRSPKVFPSNREGGGGVITPFPSPALLPPSRQAPRLR